MDCFRAADRRFSGLGRREIAALPLRVRGAVDLDSSRPGFAARFASAAAQGYHHQRRKKRSAEKSFETHRQILLLVTVIPTPLVPARDRN